MSRKKLGLLVLITIALVVVAALWVVKRNATDTNKNNASKVLNWQQCVDKGYPIQTSYPSVCSVPGGPSFTDPTEVAPATP